MRRPHVTRMLGIAVAGVAALSMGTRPPLLAGQGHGVIATAAVGGAFGGGGEKDDSQPSTPKVYLAAPPQTVAQLKVRLKLQDKLSMNFPNDTPLEDVKKYIEASTKDKADFPDGLTIYVDPLGLQDADKTMTSTVMIDLKGIPLEKTLRLLLRQLGLRYDVDKDGLVVITSDSDDDSPPADVDHEILSNLAALRTEVRGLRAEVRLLHGERRVMGGSGPLPPNQATPAGGMGGGFR